MENLKGTFGLEQGNIIYYDFTEKAYMEESMLDKEELVRPIHPISFTMGSNLIEVWYQKGIYLVMICSCLPQKGFHATNGMECAHIQILKKNFFPVLLWRIFQKRKAEIANF